MNDVTKKEDVTNRTTALSRRDLITKLGVGAGVAVATLKTASAQQQASPAPTAGLAQAPSGNVQHFPDIVESQEVITSVQPGYITKTGPGWVNNSGRAHGNGPMDECTRRIVEWVHGFSESHLTNSCVETMNYLQNDTLNETADRGRYSAFSRHSS